MIADYFARCRASVALAGCLGERYLPAEGFGQDLGQVGLVAGDRRPVGQGQPEGRYLRSGVWGFEIGGAEIEEVAPLARVLRARSGTVIARDAPSSPIRSMGACMRRVVAGQ